MQLDLNMISFFQHNFHFALPPLADCNRGSGIQGARQRERLGSQGHPSVTPGSPTQHEGRG